MERDVGVREVGVAVTVAAAISRGHCVRGSRAIRTVSIISQSGHLCLSLGTAGFARRIERSLSSTACPRI